MLWIHQRPFDGRRLARRAAARRDRLAVARARRAALRRRGRARLGRLLQPRRARGRGAGAARTPSAPSVAQALEALLFPGGRRSWEEPGAHEPQQAAAARDARAARRAQRSLDGEWEFRLVGRPEDAPRALGRARGWDAVEVPGLWTMQGFDVAAVHERRRCRSRAAAARARGEPDRASTAARSRSRAAGGGRRVVLHFGGGEGVLHVAASTASRSGSARTRARRPSSTSPTSCATTRPNELVAAVVRWSDASFVEDQDQWWHAGISRDVVVSARTRRSRTSSRAPAPTARLAVDARRRRCARGLLDAARPRRSLRASASAAARDAGFARRCLWSAEEPDLYTPRRRGRRTARRASCTSASARSRSATGGCS